ncbi:hypothetical protein L3X38_027399 [Prunus dulcis]|uniref:DUF4218 domain-containing protein n=1 Tax=Prunus dulcis TaxID=3755 RepID=A0AAD4VP33_PRUDU|nr:hypothetical protein L3X38_027399 [Prunus dulcis]
MFTLRAAVMWTVNDFPAYAMVSGWSTKGYMACPVCKEYVTSGWHAGKVCYHGHRRWLPWDHEHNLDVMHVEKNVFDTLVGTIQDIEGKTKDTIKAHLDLERMGIRRGLWMNRDNDKARRDLAFFSMKPNDKKEFLKFVSSVKFLDGYASNIARCVNVDGGKFTGLKSHDCHVFMQRLLPVAFFISMMHVMVHLPEEALLADPVNYRWMYPIERLLRELKKSVRNRAKAEGSIIEAWVQYESLTFCGMYLKDVETAFNRPQRNNDGGMRKEKLSVFAQSARPFGDPGRGESFSRNDMEVAHCCQKHRELFPQWFLNSVNKLKSSNSPTYSDELYNLARRYYGIGVVLF